MQASTSSAMARKALGAIRHTLGTLALTMPHLLVRRFSEQGQNATAATYAFRLFGVRTVIIGLELLTLKGAELQRVSKHQLVSCPSFQQLKIRGLPSCGAMTAVTRQ